MTLSFWSVLMRFLDAGVLVLTLHLAMRVRGVPWSPLYQVLALLAVLFTWTVFELLGEYRLPPPTTRFSWSRVLQGWVLVAGLLLFTGWAGKSTHLYSRIAMGVWGLLAPIGLVGVRAALIRFLRWAYRHGYGRRTAVVVGMNEQGRRLLQALQDPLWGLQPVGVFADNGPLPMPGLHRGRPEEVLAFLEQHTVDVVFLAFPWDQQRRMMTLLERLQNFPVALYLVPDVLGWRMLSARPVDLNGVPCFALFETPLHGPARGLKRLEDVVLGSLALLLFAPLMLLIALLIKVTSPGPVFFRQRRYGLGGQEIRIWKFRTMRVVEDGSEVTPASRDDPRVTFLGRILRRLSLDELPQLFNVLKGDMSLVGPRPFAVAMDEAFRRRIQGFMLRYNVKPGMTGWAQVNGLRGEITSEEELVKRLEYDLYYILHWSLWFDLKILWMTLWRGFYHPKAY